MPVNGNHRRSRAVLKPCLCAIGHAAIEKLPKNAAIKGPKAAFYRAERNCIMQAPVRDHLTVM